MFTPLTVLETSVRRVPYLDQGLCYICDVIMEFG